MKILPRVHSVGRARIFFYGLRTSKGGHMVKSKKRTISLHPSIYTILHLLPLIYLSLSCIRIRITNPNPQRSCIQIQFGSGSTTLGVSVADSVLFLVWSWTDACLIFFPPSEGVLYFFFFAYLMIFSVCLILRFVQIINDKICHILVWF